MTKSMRIVEVVTYTFFNLTMTGDVKLEKPFALVTKIWFDLNPVYTSILLICLFIPFSDSLSFIFFIFFNCFSVKCWVVGNGGAKIQFQGCLSNMMMKYKNLYGNVYVEGRRHGLVLKLDMMESISLPVYKLWLV